MNVDCPYCEYGFSLFHIEHCPGIVSIWTAIVMCNELEAFESFVKTH